MKILFRRFHEEVAFLLEARAVLMLEIASSAQEDRVARSDGENKFRDRLKPQAMTTPDGICTIPVSGSLAYNPDTWEMLFYGTEDIRNISDMFDQAMTSPDVKGVLMTVDSPGGFFTGALDVADKIAACDAVKPVVAHVGGTCASLAYLLASQAGEIVSGRSAIVGSLGAYSMNVDVSRYLKNAGIEYTMFKNKEGKFKGMGDPTQPLTGDQREHLQARTQAVYDSFINTIEGKRTNIATDAKQGQTFYGTAAQQHGLVDRLGDESFARGLLAQKIKSIDDKKLTA
jgi:capsid assembly protease